MFNQFLTKQTDSTGLVYFGARYYDPRIGRFISKDPSGMSDGPNVYIYCKNDPINYVDLWGLCGEKNNQQKDQSWWPKDIEKYIPPYGKYGGPGNTDPTFRSKPIDSMDRLFMEHDWYWAQGKGKTGDAVLLVGLSNLPLNPKKWDEPATNALWASTYREVTIEIIGWRVIINDN